MGTFRTECTIQNILNKARFVVVPDCLVDTGSELTWAPAPMLESIGVQRVKKDKTFVLANGQQITRAIGFAIVRLGKEFTVDEVVFGEPGDLNLLGARTLEGLNLQVDPAHRQLVAAGPPVAAKTTKRSRGAGKRRRKK
jgi:predicted aspartyl protease